MITVYENGFEFTALGLAIFSILGGIVFVFNMAKLAKEGKYNLPLASFTALALSGSLVAGFMMLVIGVALLWDWLGDLSMAILIPVTLATVVGVGVFEFVRRKNEN